MDDLSKNQIVSYRIEYECDHAVTELNAIAITHCECEKKRSQTYFTVCAIPPNRRTEAAPLVLRAEKKAKGTANTVLNTKDTTEYLVFPGKCSRESVTVSAMLGR